MLSKLLAVTALCQAAASPVALSDIQVQAIDRYVESEMERQQIPGLTLGVYHHGHAVLLKGYGFANIEHDVPSTPDTVMQSGSVEDVHSYAGPEARRTRQAAPGGQHSYPHSWAACVMAAHHHSQSALAYVRHCGL